MEIYIISVVAGLSLVVGLLSHLGSVFVQNQENKKEWVTVSGDAYGASSALWIVQLSLEHSTGLIVVLALCVIATLALAGRCFWLVNYRY